MGDLKPGGLDSEEEASLAKLRMEIDKDIQYEEFTELERLEDEEFEAKRRQTFDPQLRVYDARKKRVTDLKECARITLPKPLSPSEETKLEVRREAHLSIYESYREENTRSGKQKSNLTRSEEAGLKTLQERVKKGEIVIMKTDKSSRFVVTTPEEYLAMGAEHTSKDIEISWERVKEMEKTINSHSTAWTLMWGAGQDHTHTDRIVKSKVTRSGNQAQLTLLYNCLLYTSPSPRDGLLSRMPSSA